MLGGTPRKGFIAAVHPCSVIPTHLTNRREIIRRVEWITRAGDNKDTTHAPRIISRLPIKPLLRYACGPADRHSSEPEPKTARMWLAMQTKSVGRRG